MGDLLRECVTGVAKDIVSTTTTDRDDRLWPADFMVYQTNPLNLSYGACGTALFLLQALGGIPLEAEAWILRQRLSTSTYPPGLYIGLAGVARAFAWMGHMDRAEEALNLAYKSPLLFDEAGIVHGMAGWGLASVSMHSDTGNPTHLDQAVMAGEHLLAMAKVDQDGQYWPSPSDGHIHLGYAYGTSGIACFLLRLYGETGDARFRSAAIEAMNFTLQHAYKEDEKLRWFSHVGGGTLLPYWRHGTSGIGVALLRFYEMLHEDRYLEAARRAASGVQMCFAAFPCQFDGMSGVGEFLLDMHNVTHEEQYYRYAVDLAESILCFQIETEGGKSFPGRGLARLSADYAYGSAGTAAFLQRVLTPASHSLDGRLYCEG
ncbi:MAG: lanthionine synthetase C family protein [Gemmatimonadota bacterium]|nr:lanthionine synthetase C family protein [Gemmatimonadota bacterium]